MIIEETRDLATCLKLRRTVFIDEQGVSEPREVDGLDDHAIHLLAWDGERPVGTARLLISGHTGKIGRVCVLQEVRGTGLGARLIRAAVDVLKARPGVTHARLGAQSYAIGFYEKLGFSAVGKEYEDAGIPHQDMIRKL